MRRFKFIVLAIVITLLCAIPFMSSCSGGFKNVCKIVYTTNGTEKTQYSKGYASYSSWTEIEREEYFNSPSSRRISYPTVAYNLSTSFKVPSGAKGKVKYTDEAKVTDSDDLIRYRFESGTSTTEPKYYKGSYKGEGYFFVLVKVVNSTTIVIRNTTGETTYTVSSYRITYFD